MPAMGFLIAKNLNMDVEKQIHFTTTESFRDMVTNYHDARVVPDCLDQIGILFLHYKVDSSTWLGNDAQSARRNLDFCASVLLSIGVLTCPPVKNSYFVQQKKIRDFSLQQHMLPFIEIEYQSAEQICQYLSKSIDPLFALLVLNPYFSCLILMKLVHFWLH